MPYNPSIATISARNGLTSSPTTQDQKFFPTIRGLDCSPFARHYSENPFRSLFHRLLRCFTSPSAPHTAMYLLCGIPINRDGFPHSEISGLKCLFTSYPKLIAGYNVLHRPYLPRHPPYAFSNLFLWFFDNQG